MRLWTARSSPQSSDGSAGSQSSNQRESVSNETQQKAEQIDPTVNVPINVAALNSGSVDQTNGGVDQTNGNANLTSQNVSQHESSSQSAGNGQDGKSWNDGTCGCGQPDSSPQSSDGSTGSQSSDQRESVSNETQQKAEQIDPTVNVPINVAALNSGSVDQTNGGVDQTNGNANLTSQNVSQHESSSQSAGNGQDGKSWNDGTCGCGQPDSTPQSSDGSAGSQSSGQHQSVSNDSDQAAKQFDPTANVPANIAFADGGDGKSSCGCQADWNQHDGVDQTNSGANETNGNLNATAQTVWQSESSHQISGGEGKSWDSKSTPDSQSSRQSELVSNRTSQDASQFDPTANTPINAALFDNGSTTQTNGGVNQANGNLNATSQNVWQSESSTQSSTGRADTGRGGNKAQDGLQASNQHESVSNTTNQYADQFDPTANVPVNFAFADGGKSGCGCFSSSKGAVRYQRNGGVNQANGNLSATSQDVSQSEASTQSSSTSGDSQGQDCWHPHCCRHQQGEDRPCKQRKQCKHHTQPKDCPQQS